MAVEIELPDGTILEAPDGADPEKVAKAYLAKQRGAVEASQPRTRLEQRGRPANAREILSAAVDVENNPLARQAALLGRTVVEGVTDVAAPFANAVGAAANLGLQAVGSDFRFGDQGEAVSQGLTDIGVPKPTGGVERTSNVVGRFGAAMAVGGAPLTNAVLSRLGMQPTANATASAVPKATTPAARTLEKAGVPLDRSQREGGRFLQMLRGAVTNHPATATRQAEFNQTQLRSFTKAVLRSIGANADEATPEVMSAAKGRIGAVFDSIGKRGAVFDDVLQSDLANIVDDATRTVTSNDLAPLLRNIDDILNAVDDAGRINGDKFIRIRSLLSKLSTKPGVGDAARQTEDALLSALERTYPGQKRILQDAVDQWRNMRIIETAVGKGADRFISPRILSNAMTTTRNRAMSVYGQGGDQALVELARAGRSVLPEALPDSGTVPRGLMQMPIRAIATAPLYRAGQNYLLAQPTGALPPGYGVMSAPVPAGSVIDRLVAQYARP